MVQVVIPSRQNLPLAISYMLRLGRKRLTLPDYVAMLRINRRCAGFEPYLRCAFCQYAHQCAGLFDAHIDRMLWYSTRSADDTKLN